jgi:hypothetical protein
MSLRTPLKDRTHPLLLCREVKARSLPRRRRARPILSLCLAVKPVGKPDAGNPHVRFDEREWETEQLAMPQVTAPILDSTIKDRGRATHC